MELVGIGKRPKKDEGGDTELVPDPEGAWGHICTPWRSLPKEDLKGTGHGGQTAADEEYGVRSTEYGE